MHYSALQSITCTLCWRKTKLWVSKKLQPSTDIQWWWSYTQKMHLSCNRLLCNVCITVHYRALHVHYVGVKQSYGYQKSCNYQPTFNGGCPRPKKCIGIDIVQCTHIVYDTWD